MRRMEAVEWGVPWLSVVRDLGGAVLREVSDGKSVAEALNARCQAGIHFVPQSDLPEGTAYEQHIFDTRCVPTRDNLHDFFNGLVWLHWPQAKCRMNQLQAQAIAAQGVGAVRGPLRDALTVFDENGALLQAPEPLWDALRARDWQRLFIDLRPQWAQARMVLFGHALMEKLVQPRKPMVAHVYPAPIAIETIASLDAWLAQALQPRPWATKPFAPLPVLGVPGWWPANQSASFYDDAQVFRPARSVMAMRGGAVGADSASS
jgi:hypothetical protein